jgi:tryptophan-rich sensory protein
MLRRLTIPSEFIARLARSVEADPAGTRRAMIVGSLLGLAWAVPGRLWMRLITGQEPQFTLGGTIFIFVVVSGFGAAAGYAFARRGRAHRRSRRWFERALAFLPVAGLGPGLIFFVPGIALAIAATRRNGRRWLRIALVATGVGSGAFWTLVMLATDAPLVAATVYLLLGYLVYVALRFAMEPHARRSQDVYDPYAAGDVGARA